MVVEGRKLLRASFVFGGEYLHLCTRFLNKPGHGCGIYLGGFFYGILCMCQRLAVLSLEQR